MHLFRIVGIGSLVALLSGLMFAAAHRPPVNAGGELTATPSQLEPTPIPTISPDRVEATITETLQITDSTDLNGYSHTHITVAPYALGGNGWGFGPIDWLDEDHIMVTVLLQSPEEWPEPSIQPVIVNLNDNSFWLLPLNQIMAGSLGDMGNIASDLVTTFDVGGVALFDLEGHQAGRFDTEALAIFISPSGERLLAGDMLYDIPSGEVTPLGSTGGRYSRPAWTPDEQAIVFILSNETYDREFVTLDLEPGATPISMGIATDANEILPALPGRWLMEGLWFLLTYWPLQPVDNIHQGHPLALYEVATGTVHDLRTLTGDETLDNDTYDVTPIRDGRELLLIPNSENEVPVVRVDLETFQTVAYPRHPGINNSSERVDGTGNYVLFPVGEELWVLDLTGGTWTQMAGGPYGRAEWKPESLTILALTAPRNAIQALDGVAGTLLNTIQLPQAMPENTRLAWSPTGHGTVVYSRETSYLYWISDAMTDDVRLLADLTDLADISWSEEGQLAILDKHVAAHILQLE